MLLDESAARNVKRAEALAQLLLGELSILSLVHKRAELSKVKAIGRVLPGLLIGLVELHRVLAHHRVECLLTAKDPAGLGNSFFLLDIHWHEG